MTEHQNPSVWKLLPASDAVDQARADQDARWPQGNPLPAEKYLTLLPRVAADPELAMVLIYGEVVSRTERGEMPTLEEYRRRSPPSPITWPFSFSCTRRWAKRPTRRPLTRRIRLARSPEAPAASHCPSSSARSACER